MTMDEVDRLCKVVDPDEAPYTSKYAAVKILLKLRNEAADDNIVFKSELNSRLAQIYMETEEPHEAEKCLTCCLDAIEPSEWTAGTARSGVSLAGRVVNGV